MANSSIVLSSLDFDTLKNNLKTYLKSQSVFKDYDFEGSNMNVLLDVMSYNSYLNSFYLNMVASEMFLDSAQKFDSIVSHAKELNYVPRSAHSSTSEISMTLETTGLSGKLTIPKGTRFTGFNSSGAFYFVTDSTSSYVSSNNTFTVSGLRIREGSYFTDSFSVDRDIENQRFVLSNKNIDTNSITVSVIEDNGLTNTTFTRVETLFNLDAESNVYFLQAAENNQYEIVFGDGVFGRYPLNLATISVSYIITNGSIGNDVEEITLIDDLGPENNGNVDVIGIITVDAASNSGADQESLESVRFSAPRYFATQQRAVSSDDYAALVLNNFGGEIADVVVFGGELLEPKLYGRVVVVIKPSSGVIAPEYIKNRISNFLLDYIAIPNRVLISDPDYLYCSIETEVQYDTYVTDATSSEIKTIALNAIDSYSKNNLETFSSDLRFSRLMAAIDGSHPSITSNQTSLRIVKRVAPKLGYATSYVLNLNNVIYYEGQTVDAGVPHTELYTTSFDTHIEHASVISSRFTYTHNGTDYIYAYLADDGAGVLKIYADVNQQIIILKNIGTVDYTNGVITINDLVATDYLNYISIYIKPRDNDIYANQDKIILIEPTDVSSKRKRN